MGEDMWNIELMVRMDGLVEMFVGRMVPNSVHISSKPISVEEANELLSLAQMGQMVEFVSRCRHLACPGFVNMGSAVDAVCAQTGEDGIEVFRGYYHQRRNPICRDARTRLLR